jgi:hypothetical protein
MVAAMRRFGIQDSLSALALLAFASYALLPLFAELI